MQGRLEPYKEMRYLPYVLFVMVTPVVCTGGAVALLAGAFKRGRQPHPFRLLSAVGLLLAMGLLIFATASGSAYWAQWLSRSSSSLRQWR